MALLGERLVEVNARTVLFLIVLEVGKVNGCDSRSQSRRRQHHRESDVLDDENRLDELTLRFEVWELKDCSLRGDLQSDRVESAGSTHEEINKSRIATNNATTR